MALVSQGRYTLHNPQYEGCANNIGTVFLSLTLHSRNQEEEFEQKSLSSQRLVRRVRRASINTSNFKTLAFAPQANNIPLRGLCDFCSNYLFGSES
jgi:hypothetical protein